MGKDNIFEFLPMCTPQTYYTIHLKGSIVLLHGKLFLLKIYLAAAVIGMVPVHLEPFLVRGFTLTTAFNS